VVKLIVVVLKRFERFYYYRLFLARGADVEAKNNKGETPLEVIHYIVSLEF
jgi:hypothetical protein